MQKSIFIIFLLIVTTLVLKGQSLEDSLLSASIERALNKYTSETPKILLLKNGEAVTDSSFFRKATYSLNKKEVNITLQDYTHKTVPANEFWGMQTDFGQWQRFYKGEKYIVWHAQVPYIYREYEASGRKIKYFYSKTLVSEIVPLTKKNVYEIADSNAIQQLKNYLKTHEIEKSKDGTPPLPELTTEQINWLGDFIAFHVEIAWLILQLIK